MERTKLWTKVGNWFKPGTGRRGDSGGDSQITSPSTSDGNGNSTTTSATGSSLFRRSRTNPQLDRLEAEYTRVGDLIGSVQTHLGDQRDRAERIAGSLDSLAASLSYVPDATRAQLDALGAIKDQLATDGAGLRRLEENIAQLPQIADAQRETMVAIARHLEESRETTAKVVGTLDGFRESMSQVGEATSATGRAIEKIRWDQAARDERLAAILQQQTKRLSTFATAAFVLAAVATVASVIALFLV